MTEPQAPAATHKGARFWVPTWRLERSPVCARIWLRARGHFTVKGRVGCHTRLQRTRFGAHAMVRQRITHGRLAIVRPNYVDQHRRKRLRLRRLQCAAKGAKR
jgi:hypothetical protein